MDPESKLYIDGELVEAASGKTYPNINPATEDVMGEVADAGPEDMDRAIVAARRAFGWNHRASYLCGASTRMGDQSVGRPYFRLWAG